MSKLVFFNLSIILLMVVLAPTLAMATNEGSYKFGHSSEVTSYQSGYKHGVADGKIERITEDAANHTALYDQGWVDGWCSLPGHIGQYVGSDSDNGTFNCVNDESAKNSRTISTLETNSSITYTHLDGTWNFVNGEGNVSGTITFGTDKLKCNWCHGIERQYGFVVIFNFNNQPQPKPSI